MMNKWWINDNITLLTVSVYLFFKHHDLLAVSRLLSVACVSLLTTSRYASKIKMWYLMMSNCFVFSKHIHWMTRMLFIYTSSWSAVLWLCTTTKKMRLSGKVPGRRWTLSMYVWTNKCALRWFNNWHMFGKSIPKSNCGWTIVLLSYFL